MRRAPPAHRGRRRAGGDGGLVGDGDARPTRPTRPLCVEYSRRRRRPKRGTAHGGRLRLCARASAARGAGAATGRFPDFVAVRTRVPSRWPPPRACGDGSSGDEARSARLIYRRSLTGLLQTKTLAASRPPPPVEPPPRATRRPHRNPYRHVAAARMGWRPSRRGRRRRPSCAATRRRRAPSSRRKITAAHDTRRVGSLLLHADTTRPASSRWPRWPSSARRRLACCCGTSRLERRCPPRSTAREAPRLRDLGIARRAALLET